MNSWSSFKNDKIIMESWRAHLDEDIDAKTLAEDLDKELERIDELFGFGKSREDKWKAIAAGSASARQSSEKAAKKCNPGYGLNSSGVCVPFGIPDTKMPGGKVTAGATVRESTDRWQKLAGIIKG